MISSGAPYLRKHGKPIRPIKFGCHVMAVHPSVRTYVCTYVKLHSLIMQTLQTLQWYSRVNSNK